ncbi:MAG: GNAT family N-acetyltransferase [Steroidobacteraceae bacterium]|jgi:GNAT superfamily N-acetyltransferase
MNTAPKIRLARLSDVPDVGFLVSQYWGFEQIAGFERARIEKHLSELISLPERGACWVAYHAETMSGYLIAVYVFSLEHGGTIAEIDEFFVRPGFRSAGTGAALLSESEREMRGAGIVRMQLQLGLTNDRARFFYERHGYRRRSGYELYEKTLLPSR